MKTARHSSAAEAVWPLSRTAPNGRSPRRSYYGEKLDITHQFDDDGVCYVQLTNGEETVYLTVKYQNGYAMSSQKYLSPHEFN